MFQYILITIIQWKYYFQPYFKDQRIETQKNQGQATNKRLSRDLNPEYLASACLHDYFSPLSVVCQVVWLLMQIKILDSILMVLLLIFTSNVVSEESKCSNVLSIGEYQRALKMAIWEAVESNIIQESWKQYRACGWWVSYFSKICNLEELFWHKQASDLYMTWTKYFGNILYCLKSNK